MVRQNPGSPSHQLEGPRQSVRIHHPNSRAHTKVWESMVKMSQKNCEKGWKWVKVGENPKMPYPPCGRSIKTYARGNNDAPSVTKYGPPVRLDAQIVALRPHCAKGAPTKCVQQHTHNCHSHLDSLFFLFQAGEARSPEGTQEISRNRGTEKSDCPTKQCGSGHDTEDELILIPGNAVGTATPIWTERERATAILPTTL